MLLKYSVTIIKNISAKDIFTGTMNGQPDKNFVTLKEAQTFMTKNLTPGDGYQIIEHSTKENEPCKMIDQKETTHKARLEAAEMAEAEL